MNLHGKLVTRSKQRGNLLEGKAVHDMISTANVGDYLDWPEHATLLQSAGP